MTRRRAPRVRHLGVDPTRAAHRALGRVLGALDDSWESADGESLASALATLRMFRGWLGQLPDNEGLTSERDHDYAARADLGVRVTLDGGAVVVRVPRRART